MNITCQNCNQVNPPEAAFCLNCAAPISRGQPVNRQQANPQWNQPNYAAQPPVQNFAQSPAVAGKASQRATTALILALVGLFCCGPFTSIPAMIVGWMEISAIKQGQSPAAGMRFAQIGLWGGAAVTAIQIIGFILWMLLSMAGSTSDPYYY